MAMMEADTILTTDVYHNGDSRRVFVLYDAALWMAFITGQATGKLRAKNISDAKLINVPAELAWPDKEIVIADQFRLRVIDRNHFAEHSVICVPDRPFARLHVVAFFVDRFVRKTQWRIKATLQVWGVLPWWKY